MTLKHSIKNSYRTAAGRFPVIRKLAATLLWHYHYNYLSYGLHRLGGMTYREWYAKTLDSFADTPELPHIEGFETKMGSNECVPELVDN